MARCQNCQKPGIEPTYCRVCGRTLCAECAAVGCCRPVGQPIEPISPSTPTRPLQFVELYDALLDAVVAGSAVPSQLFEPDPEQINYAKAQIDGYDLGGEA